MTRIIDQTQVAVLYETITGQCQKRGVITTDTSVDIDAIIARNTKLQAIIVNRSDLPGPDQNEAFFRQQIATATATSVFAAGADRCVQVGPTAVTSVLSVHHGNVAGLDSPTGSNSLVSHLHAEVGDSFSHATGSFSRRYGVVNPLTGFVDQISNLTVGPSVPLPPIAGDVLVPSLTLQVGDVVSIKT